MTVGQLQIYQLTHPHRGMGIYTALKGWHKTLW